MNRRSADVSQPHATARGHRSRQRGSFVLSLDPGFAVGVYVYVEGHRVAADRTVLNVILVRPARNIHWYHDLFAAGVADIGSLKMRDWSSAAAAFFWFLHVPAGTFALENRPPCGGLCGRILFIGLVGKVVGGSCSQFSRCCRLFGALGLTRIIPCPQAASRTRAYRAGQMC